MKSLLKDQNIEIYLTHNEGKSVVPELSIRMLKNKIYKCIIPTLKNVCVQ